MPRLLAPTIWTRQPQQLVGIDKNNQFGALCTFAWEASTNVDIAGNRAGSGSPERRVSSDFGIECAWKDGGIQFQSPPSIVNEPFTVVACLTDDCPGSYAIAYSLGSGGVYGYGLSRSSSALRFTLYGVADYDIPCSSINNGNYQVSVFAWVYAGSVVKAYRNGVYVGQASVGTMSTSGSGGTEVVANCQNYQGWASRSVFSYKFRKAFSDAEVAEISARPRQIFAPLPRRNYIEVSSSDNVYTISPSGSITLLGSVTQIHERSLTPSGSIALVGTNLITFTNGSITYTIIPSGSISLNGTNETNRYHLLVPQGNITLSGNTKELRTRAVLPVGSVEFTGEANTAEVKVFSPNGLVTFSGTAQLYMPGMEIESTKLPLTGIGS